MARNRNRAGSTIQTATSIPRPQATQAPQYTREQMQAAAEDARTLIANSPVVRAFFNCDVISRQLFVLTQDALIKEINQGWEVQNPELVIRTLGMSAQEYAVGNVRPPLELHSDIFAIVLPVLDILRSNQQRQPNDEDEGKSDDAAVHRNDDVSPNGLGELPGGTGGDPVEQAGERGEGEAREAGEAAR